VLKLEQVFEAHKKIYMIFEDGELMSLTHLNETTNRKDTMNLIFNLLVGVIELN